MTKTANIYNKVSLGVICAMMLLGLLVMQMTGQTEMMLSGIAVSSIFQVFCSQCYAAAWDYFSRKSPEQLTKLYLASSAFRLMAAAAVLLVFCVVHRDNLQLIKWFAAIFILFYIVMLIVDAIFFAKVSKNSNK